MDKLKHAHVFDECEIPLPHSGSCRNTHVDHDWIDWNDLPVEPWNEIVPRLYIGGSMNEQPTSDEFDAVFTLWNRAPKVIGVESREWHIPDGGMPDLAELGEAVDWVSERWQEGRHVLVRCQAGLNRSSLVVALTMIKKGYTPSKTIELIRARRSKYTLCNVDFLTYLQSLEKSSV